MPFHHDAAISKCYSYKRYSSDYWHNYRARRISESTIQTFAVGSFNSGFLCSKHCSRLALELIRWHPKNPFRDVQECGACTAGFLWDVCFQQKSLCAMLDATCEVPPALQGSISGGAQELLLKKERGSSQGAPHIRIQMGPLSQHEVSICSNYKSKCSFIPPPSLLGQNSFQVSLDLLHKGKQNSLGGVCPKDVI